MLAVWLHPVLPAENDVETRGGGDLKKKCVVMQSTVDNKCNDTYFK